MSSSKDPPSVAQPLIPEKFVDVPAQRLYYLSLGLLLQAVKAFDVLQNLFAAEPVAHYGRKWLLIDLAYVALLSQLRIPRLRYSKAVILLQICSLWFLDGLLFGGISLNLGRESTGATTSSSSYPNLPDISSTPEPFQFLSILSSLSLGLIPFSSDTAQRDQHLSGQHTVRMSPISTAQLNPEAHTFCLAPNTNSVLIPVLVNNTNPTHVRYSFTPLTYVEGQPGTGRIEYIDLNAKDLKAIEQARLDSLQVIRSAGSQHRDSDDFDEYDDDDDDTNISKTESNLQKTQSLLHIRLAKPGTVRLDRVLDSSNIAARLAQPAEVTVVPCPMAQYLEDNSPPQEEVRCAGNAADLDLVIEIHGVPPLSLRWSKEVNDKMEHFLVEGIEDSQNTHHTREIGRRASRVPQKLKVPLSLTLDALGRHVYTLQSVIDGMGNIVHLHSADQGAAKSHTTRSLTVLRRPSVSFKNCGPGNPASLLIGNETPLSLSINEADALDGPWDVIVKYKAESDSGKRSKAWSKTLHTQKDKRDLTLKVDSSGEYTIASVKGKWCEGDVMAPETCKVVERPMPTAEIEWKRIHECSGDTGVAASLVLHGTPPFQVYYRTQRDASHPRELAKTFSSSRGELTLQPEHSGHYIYTFVQISDANYKKVTLDGPTIEQIVHPLAAADFTNAAGRARKSVSSCEGGTVSVEVDLRGTPPWNLELQIIGPKSTDTLEVHDITSSPTRIQVPIPSAIDKEGGIFDVDLVSVEDSYGCKRSISVPGVSVNVRRVKPTIKFYGKQEHRSLTVLEDEQADLPLRLTGDGPWTVKYRRVEDPDRIQTVSVKSPNDHLHVKDKGVYEITDVADSQCPGSVLSDENTYTVEWVPRPSARLAQDIPSTFEPYNRSNILAPICRGHDDHVDLELTGRPPFQIMYNVARNDESGGTIVIDQPTFSSIQSHTRFQLHTSTAGRKYYEVKQIGDSAYPLAKHKNVVIPRSERLLFEQEVFSRPSARFKTDARISYCLNDILTPQDSSSEGVIEFEGTPPFEVQLSIRSLTSSKFHKENVIVQDRLWKVDLPSYQFTSIGPHRISIESVQDSSRCEQADLDPSRRSIYVDVAEIAAIIPSDKKTDFCVGDVTQFQLEGTPPWSIGYRINGKSYVQEAKVSPFSMLQQQTGEFTITSVAHQQKMCKAAVTDLQFAVHPLPSAQIGHGKRIFQDIHEGDQAEILFTLVGEPPFTFTYQRSEPSSKKGGKPGKVLETHTVSGVTTNEYSVFSALEGTWTVTSISDRYCRYPSQPDGIGETSRR
ncbi:hypothetical protein BJ138DRAFT_475130 [Hygrophoropsis aurantiaca]|uniref:Uncharacterized protein n=1 Tax=Hygrophoropsis aurantiaca TaxID=72124 RepID=A0ACB8ATA8_9AGAM|nr:hypothetical protein BJ138DRAFT_475130 [Hygrophoropsis aurantiaca]